MSYLLATFVAAVLLSSETFGKTVTGTFKSDVARQQNGQFITKFMYQGNVDDADVLLLTCHLSTDRVSFCSGSVLAWRDDGVSVQFTVCVNIFTSHFNINIITVVFQLLLLFSRS